MNCKRSILSLVLVLVILALFAIPCSAIVSHYTYSALNIGTGGIGVGARADSYSKIRLNYTGDFKINTNKFTIAGATGNTLIAGTTNAVGNFAVNTNKFNVTAASGNTTLAGTLSAVGDFKVNTDKFVVTAASGNTVIAGTLGADGDFKINTNKFVVTAASGNTAIAGTLGSVGDFKVNTDKFVVTAASGNTTIAGTMAVTDAATFSSTVKQGVGYAVMNQRFRVTTAEVNAGKELLPAIAGRQYRMLDCKMIAYGGAVTATTTVDILGTQTGSVKLAAFAQANLTQSTVLVSGATGSAVLADGASYIANDVNTAITIAKTGDAVATATGVDVILSYVVE